MRFSGRLSAALSIVTLRLRQGIKRRTLSSSRLRSASAVSQSSRRMSRPATATAKMASTALVTTQNSGIAQE
jgi:hypothetical protein